MNTEKKNLSRYFCKWAPNSKDKKKKWFQWLPKFCALKIYIILRRHIKIYSISLLQYRPIDQKLWTKLTRKKIKSNNNNFLSYDNQDYLHIYYCIFSRWPVTVEKLYYYRFETINLELLFYGKIGMHFLLYRSHVWW